jgi:EmrB/QacA subfamily drug resistance transporter
MWAILRDPCAESVIRAQSAAAPSTKSHARWILVATILASSMAFIDGTVVNVALPALQAKLNATATDVQWVVEAYSLFLSALLLVGGSLGDHYGRRNVFLIGVIVFALASAACGLAPNIRLLIVARALQGLGAALLVPGSLAIISNSFSENERGRAIGIWSGFSAITTGLGPLAGGWLIENVSWRAAFFINIPIAIAVVFISLRHVSENSDEEKTKVDWIGAILAALGLGALVYGLIESSRVGFGNRAVVIVLIAAILLTAIFLVVESRLDKPMLPLGLFRSRTFAGTNLLTFLLYAALGGTLFFLPLNLIQIQHYSATAAGAALLPFILLMFGLSRWSGGLVVKYGPKLPLVVGPSIVALGYLFFVRPRVGGSYWINFFPPVLLLGLGMAISVAPLTTTVMSSVPQNRAGVASGVNNAVARAAGLIAIAVLGIAMLHVFSAAIDRRINEWKLPSPVASSLHSQRTKLAAIVAPPDADLAAQQLIQRAVDESFVVGFRTIMLIGAGLASASAATALFLIRRPSGR